MSECAGDCRLCEKCVTDLKYMFEKLYAQFSVYLDVRSNLPKERRLPFVVTHTERLVEHYHIPQSLKRRILDRHGSEEENNEEENKEDERDDSASSTETDEEIVRPLKKRRLKVAAQSQLRRRTDNIRLGDVKKFMKRHFLGKPWVHEKSKVNTWKMFLVDNEGIQLRLAGQECSKCKMLKLPEEFTYKKAKEIYGIQCLDCKREISRAYQAKMKMNH